MADKILKTESEVKKTFNYTLEGVNINFTLRIDIKKELKAAREICLRAAEDFKNELEAIK